jgi:hypothetical protein
MDMEEREPLSAGVRLIIGILLAFGVLFSGVGTFGVMHEAMERSCLERGADCRGVSGLDALVIGGSCLVAGLIVWIIATVTLRRSKVSRVEVR